jgi:hypothetical protein
MEQKASCLSATKDFRQMAHSRTSSLKRHALRVVFLKPFFRGVDIRKYLEMFGIADSLARVDVDQDCHWSLLSFRFP